jgi:hypothetical protein
MDLAPTIADLRSTGTTTLKGIADELNNREIPAARGGSWRLTGVLRLLERLSG